MYSPAKRYQFDGKATSVPYRGPKRLHMTLGLIFGVGAVTWAFSGLLSMDPFPAPNGSLASDSARVVTFMAGGAALSVTSVILAWRVVRPRAFQGTSRPPAAGHTAI